LPIPLADAELIESVGFGFMLGRVVGLPPAIAAFGSTVASLGVGLGARVTGVDSAELGERRDRRRRE
jgi:hypothetical protein